MNQQELQLSRYNWYKHLPLNWKRITRDILSKIGTEEFMGDGDLQEALADMDEETLLALLADRGGIDVVSIEQLLEED